MEMAGTGRRTRLAVGLVGLLVAAGCADGLHPPVSLPEGRRSVTVPLDRARRHLLAKAALDGRGAGCWLMDMGPARTWPGPRAPRP